MYIFTVSEFFRGARAKKKSQQKQKRKTYRINTDVRRNHVLYIPFRFPFETQSRFVYNTPD